MTKYCMSQSIRVGKDGCTDWRWGECVFEGQCVHARHMDKRDYTRLCEGERSGKSVAVTGR